MKNTALLFRGKQIRLYKEKRRLPNKVTVDLEFIHHPGAVLILPLLDDNRIVFIRQYRATIDSYIWELPAGNLKTGEHAKACAYRELIEETGYKAGLLEKIGFIYPAPGYTDEQIMLYRAKKLTYVGAQRERDEVMRVELFSRKQVRQLVRSGKLVDAKTICALTLSRSL
jgi:ADP-ribose pyrophosphatase